MSGNVSNNYYTKAPYGDCPYRKDAPIQKWAREEFIDLANAGIRQKISYCRRF
jgi:hypothetical protein